MGEMMKITVFNPHKEQVTYEQDKKLRTILLKEFKIIEEIWLDIFYTFKEDSPAVEVEDSCELSEAQVKKFQGICYEHFGMEFTCRQS